LPGDAGRDGQFDQGDVIQTLQSNKYRTGEFASFSEGDWNGDFKFDQRDLVKAFSEGNYLNQDEKSGEEDEIMMLEIMDARVE